MLVLKTIIICLSCEKLLTSSSPKSKVQSPLTQTQSKIQVQLGLGVTLKSHGPPPHHMADCMFPSHNF